MQNSAQNLPEAHIIASANSENSPKAIVVFFVVFFVVIGLGVAGYLVYTKLTDNSLESKLLQSIQTAPPAPTIGIPTSTPLPSPTRKPTPLPSPTPEPVIIINASDSAIPLP